MSNPAKQLSQSYDTAGRVAQILQTRTRLALALLRTALASNTAFDAAKKPA